MSVRRAIRPWTRVLLAGLAIPCAPSVPDSIYLDGKPIAAAKLPESLPEALRTAAAGLEAWGDKHRLRIHVSEKDTILFAAPAGFLGAAAIQQKLRAAADDFVKRFHALPAQAVFEVVSVEAKEALAGYVDTLVAREDYLKPWAAGAKETPGFWLHRPLAAAYFRNPKDPQEKKAEFNLENQLVHQFGHLLVNATLGRQPYWVQESVAWSLEQARQGTIYAFCHRSGFVFRKEHGGWPKIGKSTLTAGAALPLDKIFALDRQGEFEKELGAASMVLTEFLASKHRPQWESLVASFRAELEAAKDPNQKIPVERQRALFEAAFGEGSPKAFLDELRR